MTRLLIAIAVECQDTDELAQIEAAFVVASRAISEAAQRRILYDARAEIVPQPATVNTQVRATRVAS